jgi:hypothetical protein
MNADKDVDTDKLLDSNNKILDSPNNLDKVKSGQKTKKQKKDTPLICCMYRLFAYNQLLYIFIDLKKRKKAFGSNYLTM